MMDLHLDEVDIIKLKEKEISVIFSALPANIAEKFERKAAANGIAIFSNACAHRMNQLVPILIPEINYEHIQLVNKQRAKLSQDGFIVTNANCTTTGLCLSLAPLEILDIDEIVVSSYQALSGAGIPGHSALEMGANCIPFISGEEEKMILETNKIFGKQQNGSIISAQWNIYPHCVRVPTPVGHLLSVHVKVKKETELSTIVDLFQNYMPHYNITNLPTAPLSPILLLDEAKRPQPRLDAGAGTPSRASGMAITVGRLNSVKSIIRFVTLSNNLIRGAAGGSILNAELAFQEDLL